MNDQITYNINIESFVQGLDKNLHNYFMLHQKYPEIIVVHFLVMDKFQAYMEGKTYMDIAVMVGGSYKNASYLMNMDELVLKGKMQLDGLSTKWYRHPKVEWQGAGEAPNDFEIIFDIDMYHQIKKVCREPEYKEFKYV